jgi:hypothetical protein
MEGPSARPSSVSAYSTFGGDLRINLASNDAILLQLSELLDQHLLVHARDPLLKLREAHRRLGGEELDDDDDRAGSVCLNSFGRLAKWISASIMPPPSLVPAR